MIGNKNLNYIPLFELIVDMRRYFIYLLTIVCFCSLHAQNYECSTIQTHRIEVTKSLDKHPDSLALEILSPYSQGVDSLIGGVIGYSDMLMTADRPESLLSNFVADAYVTEAKKMGYNVDFAICNVGGLRSDMPEGAVTKGNILNIAPFQNYFTIVELKGEYVLELFAQIAQSLGEGVSKEVGLVIDGNGTLISSSLKGKAIKPNKTYKIATINYLAEGNDRMEAFKKASKCIVKDDLAQDVLIHYITDENQAGRHLTSSLDGRIKVVGGNPSLDDFEKKRKQDVELLVVHTNDTHSCILPLDPNSVNKSIADKGGYIRRSTLINEMREVDPDLLLLDCGDFSQGSAYYSLYKGEVEVQLMNHMKYDASTIGNHEFDYGIDNMVRIFKMANFPILCCNYDFGETALKDIVKPYAIINRKGLNITKKDTDYLITTREFGLLIKEFNIDVNTLEDSKFDSPMQLGSSSGVIFGVTGGVCEAGLRTAYYYLTNKDLPNDKLVFQSIRGMQGIKEASIDINGRVVKVAVCNGMNNAVALIDRLLKNEVHYD